MHAAVVLTHPNPDSFTHELARRAVAGLRAAGHELGGRALALLDQVVAETPGGHVVMCSHGDIIPSLMAALAGRDGLALSDVHRRKGARFTLQFKGPKCVAVEAVPPP